MPCKSRGNHVRCLQVNFIGIQVRHLQMVPDRSAFHNSFLGHITQVHKDLLCCFPGFLFLKVHGPLQLAPGQVSVFYQQFFYVHFVWHWLSPSL